VKQIYDKHKEIWWAQVNANEWMTWDDFLRLQNIAYLNWKHKRGTWCLCKNPTFLFNHGFVFIMMMFLFPRYKWSEWDSSPIHLKDPNICATSNHVPIQSQHGISMDATFGTNDVKYHVFTLMAFDFHQIGVLIVWVLTSWQTCEDLVEWLGSL
jgi:hypothetical protein